MMLDKLKEWIATEGNAWDGFPGGQAAQKCLANLMAAIERGTFDSPVANEGGLMPEPILKGRWHYGNLHLCCGTLRIMRADFDTITDLSEQNKIMQNICDILNTRPTTGWRPMETAPKDGKPLLLDWGGKARYASWLDNSKTMYPWAGWRVPSGEPQPIGAPIGWHPLPPTQGERG